MKFQLIGSNKFLEDEKEETIRNHCLMRAIQWLQKLFNLMLMGK